MGLRPQPPAAMLLQLKQVQPRLLAADVVVPQRPVEALHPLLAPLDRALAIPQVLWRSARGAQENIQLRRSLLGFVLGRIANSPPDVHRGMSVMQFRNRLVGRTGASHTVNMANGYRVTEAMDGTFHVELWSARGGRNRLIYKTRGFQTRELAEAWIVPVEDDPTDGTFPPRSRVVYLKPRSSMSRSWE